MTDSRELVRDVAHPTGIRYVTQLKIIYWRMHSGGPGRWHCAALDPTPKKAVEEPVEEADGFYDLDKQQQVSHFCTISHTI